MKKTPQEIEMMLSEVAHGLKSGDIEVYVWLHGQLKECKANDKVSLAMGVIAHLMPNFPFADGPLH
jgi:hypothetical protein